MPLCMPLPLARCPKQATWHWQAGDSQSRSSPLPRRGLEFRRPQVRRSSPASVVACCVLACRVAACHRAQCRALRSRRKCLSLLCALRSPHGAVRRRHRPQPPPGRSDVSPTCPEVQHSRHGVLACRVCICPPGPSPPSQLQSPARPLAEPDSAPTTRRDHSGPERGLPPPAAFWDSGGSGTALPGPCGVCKGIYPPGLWDCRELRGLYNFRTVRGRGEWRPRGPAGPRRQGSGVGCSWEVGGLVSGC